MEMNEVLARAFACMLVSIDLSDDEDIDPDVATSILEPACALFGQLSEADKRTVAGLLVKEAESEDDPVRREALLNLPETMGLLDEE
ncbi:hypothetical protein GCM10022226_43040 [Sphaerisporangium flaviroseum]|uniref:HEAT repeat domain-containing protein n=1 Tax=Sphaerisporangium flaviroseum TaxID=509199 RepID=A0ABP7IGG4_9ACTN